MKVKIFEPQKGKFYHTPTRVYYGRGSINKLPTILKKNKKYNILLISGRHLNNNDNFENFLALLKKSSRVSRYDVPIKKSDFNTINDLIKYVSSNKFDCIIGMGGGTIIDCSKIAAAVGDKDIPIQEYVVTKNVEIQKKGIFYIAIPTTSGTGSEVTPWSTIWGDDKKKYSLFSPQIFADYAIVDASLNDSLPTSVTAESGIDALCQAIEAYWSTHSNIISDKYAIQAIDIIINNLEKAVNKPSPSIRDKMALGSLLGGFAFSQTQTTICHSISYPMSIHWNIVHGQATSISLPIFITINFPLLRKIKLKKILISMGVKSIKEAAKKITVLMINIGLKTKLSHLQIPINGIDIIVSEGFHPDRINNAPWIPTKQQLRDLLFTIY